MHVDTELARLGRELRAAGARLHALRTEIQALWDERTSCADPERAAELTRRYLTCQSEWDREYAVFEGVYASWNLSYRELVRRARPFAGL